jgi:hypothetical protein
MDGKIIGRRVRLGQCSFPLRASVRDSPPAGNLCPAAQSADASDPLLTTAALAAISYWPIGIGWV